MSGVLGAAKDFAASRYDDTVFSSLIGRFSR
jgi:hypothetical protein